MKIKRTLQSAIEKELFKGRAIIVYGPRRVGKTTLIRQVAAECSEKSLYLNCDEPDIRENLTGRTSTELKRFIGSARLVLIDEAQRVADIGLTIKLLVDNCPEIQLLVTGSSSFELSNSVVEPLTGRKREFRLHPFSAGELLTVFSELELQRMIPELLVRGSYPEIILYPDEAEQNLAELCRSYLYKDILTFADIRNSEALDKLLKALALQTGNEVSYTELGQICGIDKHTVRSYIQVLEQAFIILSTPI